MITKRDMGIACITVCITLTVVGFAQAPDPIMQSSIFDWLRCW